MKNFIKDWLANFALIVLCINIVSFIINRNWSNVSFILELFFVTLLIRLLQILTNKFTSNYPILEYLLEFGMVSSIVFIFGRLFGWYTVNEMWFIFVIIIIAYTIAYVLDLTKTSRDVAYINEQIKKIRMNQRSTHHDN